MRSVPWAKPGQWNLKGKKTKPIMAGKYVEEVLINFCEKEHIKNLNKEIKEYL